MPSVSNFAFQECRDMEGTLREQLEAYAAQDDVLFRPMAKRSIAWWRGSAKTAAAKTRRGRAIRCALHIADESAG